MDEYDPVARIEVVRLKTPRFDALSYFFEEPGFTNTAIAIDEQETRRAKL